MNIFLKIITSLGFLTVIVQFLGIPHSWKEIISVVIGVAVMLVAFFIDRITLFLQNREDTRYREDASPRTSRQAVSAFSTPLSTVTEAFSEVAHTHHAPVPPVTESRPARQEYRHEQVQQSQEVKRTPVPVPVPIHVPVPHPVPAPHTTVPQSHTHVQEMARVFQRQNSTPATQPQQTPPATVSAPSVTTAPAVSKPVSIPEPVASKPASPPQSQPMQPIKASQYSSTPLSSLNAPAVALHIVREAKSEQKVKSPRKVGTAEADAVGEKKKASSAKKSKEVNVKESAEVLAPTKPKSRKKTAAPKPKEDA